jgi:hypothetical protein
VTCDMNKIFIAMTSITAALTLTVCTAAQAHASPSPNVVGQKYGDATAALAGAGFSPVVSTTVGAALPWPECVVTHQKDRSVQPPPNTQWNGGEVTHQTLLALNCNAAVAAPGTPGNSHASPEGRAAATSEQP